MKVKVEIKGLEEAQKLIQRYGKEKKAEIRKVIEKKARQIRDDARSRAPYRTGFLRSKILDRILDGGLTGEIYVDNDAFYGRFLEFGTVKMRERPFLFPAAEANTADFVADLKKKLRDTK